MKKKVILGFLLGAIIVLGGFSITMINKNTEGTTKVEVANNDSLENNQENLETNKMINENIIDIAIPDDKFITTMDSVFDNLPFFIGKRMKVEGIVTNVTENGFAIIRLYDMTHEDHSHEVTVGITAEYEGPIPEEESWVEVIGKIEKKIINGNLSPVLKVEKIENKFSWGQAKVYN